MMRSTTFVPFLSAFIILACGDEHSDGASFPQGVCYGGWEDRLCRPYPPGSYAATGGRPPRSGDDTGSGYAGEPTEATGGVGGQNGEGIGGRPVPGTGGFGAETGEGATGNVVTGGRGGDTGHTATGGVAIGGRAGDTGEGAAGGVAIGGAAGSGAAGDGNQATGGAAGAPGVNPCPWVTDCYARIDSCRASGAAGCDSMIPTCGQLASRCGSSQPPADPAACRHNVDVCLAQYDDCVALGDTGCLHIIDVCAALAHDCD